LTFDRAVDLLAEKAAKGIVPKRKAAKKAVKKAAKKVTKKTVKKVAKK